MEISTKGIYEIGVRGKEIYLQYKTEKDAWEADKKLNDDLIKEIGAIDIF